MSVTLSLILPRERGRLASLLAPYFAEVAPQARIDPTCATSVANEKVASSTNLRNTCSS